MSNSNNTTFAKLNIKCSSYMYHGRGVARFVTIHCNRLRCGLCGGGGILGRGAGGVLRGMKKELVRNQCLLQILSEMSSSVLHTTTRMGKGSKHQNDVNEIRTEKTSTVLIQIHFALDYIPEPRRRGKKKTKSIVTSSASPTYDPEPATGKYRYSGCADRSADSSSVTNCKEYGHEIKGMIDTDDKFRRTELEATLYVHGTDFMRLLQIQLDNSGPIFDE
ncbi:hypothetical protein Tco_1320558 [Tanacetum coccineum]|uniref:Uncharacterized protein n=1 Tax=Tanacetum coccineum TaxID=301880 RepID=A0ABQ4ZGY2_9ASTR